MLILGIESSCDETAAGVVDLSSRKVLANVISSQVQVHQKYGGVVPEIASRQHLKSILPVIQQALSQASISLKQIGGVAVTYGPGLAGSLLVGLSAAKALALAIGKPLVGVNHLEGHLLAAFLEYPKLEFPFLGLVVSGGHTSLYVVRSIDDHQLLAATRDDAAGEAFDKVAKLLGMEYPGGPALDRAAGMAKGQGPRFPQASMKDGSQDFSFSGIKTSVWLYLESQRKQGSPIDAFEVAKGFQETVTDLLMQKMLRAADEQGLRRLVLGGGVAANTALRSKLKEAASQGKYEVFIPSIPLCMDNGAMIAYAGGLRLARGEQAADNLGVVPNLRYS